MSPPKTPKTKQRTITSVNADLLAFRCALRDQEDQKQAKKKKEKKSAEQKTEE
jgi:hypothetical protein